MSVIGVQKNGLYCRYDSKLNKVTDYDMTEEDYINICVEEAKIEAEIAARDIIKNYTRDWETFCLYAENSINKELLQELNENHK